MARKRVIIVGAGPAGLSAALELSKNPNLEILIFDKGPHIKERTKDNLVSGLGGAGAFSDGKLTLPDPDYPKSLEVGGQLVSIIGQERYFELVDYVNGHIYTEFGGRPGVYEKDKKKIQELVDRASTFELRITPTRTRHFGSDLAPKIVKNIAKELKKRGVDIRLETPVKSIKKEGNRFSVRTGGKSAGLYKAKYVIAAPGRDGARWLTSQAELLGIEVLPREMYVDVGVRVEVPDQIFAPLTDCLYDVKIEYYPRPFDDRVRTFCVCLSGEVVAEKYRGLLTTVNGHSLYEKPLSKNTNFALLVSVKFDKPFKDPLKFARGVSERANELAGGEDRVLVQRLGDLRKGQRSTEERIAKGFVEPSLKEAVPGDITFAVPYRQMTDILGMLKALDKIAPGVNGEHTLLYAAEVKFYSSRIKTGEDFETSIPGFYVAGDGSGYTRGLMQSSMMGVIVAKSILKKTSGARG